MKTIASIVFISFSITAYSLGIDCNNISSFCLGKKVTIRTTQNSTKTQERLTYKPKLFIEDQNINYQINKMNDTTLEWTFEIPKINNLVGKNKTIKLSTNEELEKINIYSEKPILISSSNQIDIFNIDSQTISFTFKNSSYVKGIGFNKDYIYINNIKTRYIDCEDKFFKNDTLNNTITIPVSINSTNPIETINVIFYYTNEKIESDTTTTKIGLKIINRCISKNCLFLEKNVKYLYLDDFTRRSNNPILSLKISSSNNSSQYRISTLDSNFIDITNINGSKEIRFDNNNVQIKVNRVEKSGRYPIILKYENSIYSTYIDIKPIPNITNFTINNNTNNTIYSTDNKYRFKLFGNKLDEMKDDLEIEAVNDNDGSIVKLEIENDLIENALIANLATDTSTKTGKYHLQIKRNYNNTPIIYPMDNLFFNVEYPKIIDTAQITEIKPHQCNIIKEIKGIKEINKTKGIKEINKTNEIKEIKETNNTYIIDKKSPISICISPTSNIPQYINIKARYYKNDGSILKTSINDGINEYITINNKKLYIDLKNYLSINDFNINEKIYIEIEHSPKVYGNTSTFTKSNSITFYRHSSFLEKIGITLTLPPYIAAIRNVRRKNFYTDQNGNIYVKYDGEKKMEIQSLSINAGIGFKYRPKNKNYEPSDFAVGLYVMGSDLANSIDLEKQLKDKDNYNFVRRGSFNLMLLGEYSFFNLDNPNTRIPIYFGTAFIPDPIDSGSNFAYVVGIGIDIKLFGSN